MQLDSGFSVTAPIDQVWQTLMDFEKVAGCVPGAQVLNKLSEDAYQVAMKVKLGPITMHYKGQMEVIERDEASHRAVLTGQAKETRGQGTAQATAQLQLVEDGETTKGTVSADVALSGRAAAMGQGIIGGVTDHMMGQFARNLQIMLNDAGTAALSAEAELTDAAQTPVESTAPEAPAEPAAHAAPAAPKLAPAAAPARPPAAARSDASSPSAASASADAGSLDALALARGMIEAQLREPRRVLQLLVVVAVIAYRAGRRANRHEHTH